MQTTTELLIDSSSPSLVPSAYLVKKKDLECPRVVSLWLSPLENHDDSFKPGQFLMVYVFGVGEAAISIAERGEEPGGYLITVRSVGTVSRALEHCKEKDVVGIRGPFGNGWPLKEAQSKNILLIAGGIGLPPLWSALSFILKNRSCYRDVFLLYGVRSPRDILYKEKLEALSKGQAVETKIAVELATSRTWNGTIGNVISLMDSLSFDPQKAVAFVCGPEPMMRFCAYALMKRGLAQENIYFSLERNMRCALGSCGHCQLGPLFLCKNGPVFSYQTVGSLLNISEI